MTDIQSVLPKWALLLFDSDSCTMLAKTSSLDCSESVDVSSTLNFRHGKNIYKAEILALADSKKDLDSFEKEWEQTPRAEAIQTAQYQKQEGAYLDIQPELEQHWVDGEGTDGSPCTVQPDATDLLTEIPNLKSNQALMLSRIGELTDALQDVRNLLDQRVKKKREKVRNQLAALPLPKPLCALPPTTVPDSPQEGCASPTVPDDNISSRHIPLPERNASTGIEPGEASMLVDRGLQPLSPSLVTSGTSNANTSAKDDDFSHDENMLCLDLTPRQNCRPSLAFTPSSSPTCSSSLRFDAETSVAEPVVIQDCPSRGDLRTLARPSVNIGSVRNPILLDSAKYERVLKMHTPQRFILAAMDLAFSNQEMAESKISGGLV